MSMLILLSVSISPHLTFTGRCHFTSFEQNHLPTRHQYYSNKPATRWNNSIVIGQSVYVIQIYWSFLLLSNRPPVRHWTGHYAPPLLSLVCSHYSHISIPIISSSALSHHSNLSLQGRDGQSALHHIMQILQSCCYREYMSDEKPADKPCATNILPPFNIMYHHLLPCGTANHQWQLKKWNSHYFFSHPPQQQ